MNVVSAREMRGGKLLLLSDGQRHELHAVGGVYGVALSVTSEEMWELAKWLRDEATKLEGEQR